VCFWDLNYLTLAIISQALGGGQFSARLFNFKQLKYTQIIYDYNRIFKGIL